MSAWTSSPQFGVRGIGAIEMIDVKVEESTDKALAELISSTLHGHIPTNPSSPATQVGQLVRDQQERDERERPSRQEIETVNFATLDPENDWSDV